MAKLTLAGAKRVTADMERIAEVVQREFAVLGIPEKVAMD